MPACLPLPCCWLQESGVSLHRTPLMSNIKPWTAVCVNNIICVLAHRLSVWWRRVWAMTWCTRCLCVCCVFIVCLLSARHDRYVHVVKRHNILSSNIDCALTDSFSKTASLVVLQQMYTSVRLIMGHVLFNDTVVCYSMSSFSYRLQRPALLPYLFCLFTAGQYTVKYVATVVHCL